MKIGVSTANLTRGGGMERYALDLITALTDRGIPLEVVTRRFDPGHPLVRRLGSRLHRVGVGLVPGKLRDAYFSWRLDGLRKKLGLDVLIACGRVKYPDVAICGGTHRGYLAALGRAPGLADRLHIAMEDSQYAHARVIVAHSRLMADELVRLYNVEPGRIRLLYPPVDSGRFRPVSAERRRELRRRFGFPEDRHVFLFPSGGHERKGLPFLQKYFERTDLPVELAVAGRAVAGRNIRSLGYVRDMENLYPAASATILAPVYEPFGLVGVESALCGVPALLPASMGCSEVLKPPALAPFRLGDQADLDRAVREIVDRGGQTGPNLSPFIGYDFRVETHAEEVLKLLMEIQ